MSPNDSGAAELQLSEEIMSETGQLCALYA